MNYTIKSPDSLKASVKLPASKSICNRALILNALSYSPYEIRNLSDCDDTEVMVKNRPIKILVDALNALGARVEYMEKEGYPPLRIFGSALQGGEISLAGGVSSQYISALLMIAPLMENGLTLHLEGVVISKPYQPDIAADGTIWGKGGMERADH